MQYKKIIQTTFLIHFKMIEGDIEILKNVGQLFAILS